MRACIRIQNMTTIVFVKVTNLIQHVPPLPLLLWTRTRPSILGHQRYYSREIDQAVEAV